MGDFVELIIFLAVVFFSLLAGGSKKKKKRAGGTAAPAPPRQRPQQPRAQPVRSGTTRSPGPRVERRPEPPVAADRQSLAQQIFDMLSDQLPEVTEVEPSQPEPSEAVSLERVDFEPQSLETLEPDRRRTHDEFHERYVDDSQPARVLRRKGRISPANAREAVIWKAIFSPPKGME